MEAVVCRKLSFTYAGETRPVLSELNFDVKKGEFCLLTGESASGKSTLLKLLKKELAPKGTLVGSAECNGFAGIVTQNVEESIVCDTVLAELSFGLACAGVAERELDLRCAEAASYFNLEDKLYKKVSELSGGEKQLLNLAATVIMRPSVLLLDEPCSQLDPVSATRFIDCVKALNRDFNITVIIIEHTAENLFDIADSVMLLSGGSLLIKETPDRVEEYMKKTSHPLLEALPAHRRLGETLSLATKAADESGGETVLSAKHISFGYEKNRDVLSDLSLNVCGGKINALLGANSSGKTTLLNLLAGVKKPQRGRIKADGRVSMLCQNVRDLFSGDTCGEEAEFGELTERFGISHLKQRHPYDISAGEAQRLALVKVLERGADIILLDEPTQGLDVLLKKELAAILKGLCSEGKTVLIASHDLEFIGEFADTVSFVSGGRIVSSGGRREFFSTMTFYTTALAKLTQGRVISFGDIEYD